MIVYHGTTLTVAKPLVRSGRPDLDFGCGFYVTVLEEQARKWAERMAGQRHEDPCLNVYTFDLDNAVNEFRYKEFPAYDEEWLDFIVANRSGQELWKQYDIVQGGIANDRVVDTIEAYMAGNMTKDVALGRLAENAPNNQICLLDQAVIDKYLKFEQAIRI